MTATTRLGDLERELTRFFRRARTVSAAIAEEVHPDLDVASYSVLVAVSDLAATLPSGVRAADVGEALGLHKSTMSRNLAVLERLGLVEREPSPDDARARLLRLTPLGRRSLDDAVLARRQHVSDTLATWPDADVDELARLLNRLNTELF